MLKDAQVYLQDHSYLHVADLLTLDAAVNQMLDDVCLRASDEWTKEDFREASYLLWSTRHISNELSERWAQYVRLQESSSPLSLIKSVSRVSR